jgi:hypothetical protein
MSTLYVDNLQPNLGDYVHAEGHVVNYKVYNWSSYTTVNSTSYVLARSASYTPKKAGNLIIVDTFGRLSMDVSVIALVDFGISIDGGLTFIGGHEIGNATASYVHNDRQTATFKGDFIASSTSPVTIGIYQRDHNGVDNFASGAYWGTTSVSNKHGFTVTEIAQ